MINYSLKCENGHQFDSWFQSAETFDTLNEQSQIECPVCGSHKITKSMMAPSVQTKRKKTINPPSPQDAETALSDLKALQSKIEENSDYVGANFARDARDMHNGLIPERSIHGHANPDEAKKLIDDGVSIVPLPFAPKRKVN